MDGPVMLTSTLICARAMNVTSPFFFARQPGGSAAPFRTQSQTLLPVDDFQRDPDFVTFKSQTP
jgi:hypothetical protein